MKTQNGHPVGVENRDSDLWVDQGFGERYFYNYARQKSIWSYIKKILSS
jgi:hypothetical protein